MMQMIPAPRRLSPLIGLGLAGAVALSGCMTHRVTPTLSKAVVEARRHSNVTAARASACPDLAAPILVGFAFGEAAINELAGPALAQASAALACHPGSTVLIVADADNHGTDAEQHALAQSRAAAVADQLRGGGVAAGRIQTRIQAEAPAAAPNRLVVLAQGRRW